MFNGPQVVSCYLLVLLEVFQVVLLQVFQKDGTSSVVLVLVVVLLSDCTRHFSNWCDIHTVAKVVH